MNNKTQSPYDKNSRREIKSTLAVSLQRGLVGCVTSRSCNRTNDNVGVLDRASTVYSLCIIYDNFTTFFLIKTFIKK